MKHLILIIGIAGALAYGARTGTVKPFSNDFDVHALIMSEFEAEEARIKEAKEAAIEKAKFDAIEKALMQILEDVEESMEED